MKRRWGRRVLSLVMALSLLLLMVPAAFGAELSDSQIVKSGGKLFYGAAGEQVSANSLGQNNSVVSLSKTIKGTDTANEFIVTLEVETLADLTTVQVSEDAAVVLVLDISGSMSGNMRVLKDAAKNFLDSYAAGGGSTRYVSLVTFASNATIAYGWTDVSDPAQMNGIKDKIESLNSSGNTYIQGGLQLARNLLSADALNTVPKGNGISNRSVILFSDGVANQSNSNTTNTDFAANTVINSNLSSNAAASAENMATEVKSNKANLYTIGFGSGAPTTWLRDNIATDPSCAYSASDAAQLNKVFDKISQDIEKRAQGGIVTDPMGKNIKFIQAIPQSDIDSGLLKFENNTLQWNLKEATPTKNGNVSTYTYSYRIKLNPDVSDSAKTYPTNGETTLQYVMINNTVEGDLVKANFMIPVVKAGAVVTPKAPASGY